MEARIAVARILMRLKKKKQKREIHHPPYIRFVLNNPRRCRGRRLVENQLPFYQRNLSKSALYANVSKTSLRLTMQRMRLIRRGKYEKLSSFFVYLILRRTWSLYFVAMPRKAKQCQTFLTEVLRTLLFCSRKLLFSDVLVAVVAVKPPIINASRGSKSKNTLPLRYTKTK